MTFQLRTSNIAALWLLAFAAAAVIGTHGLAYWDSGDYTLLAITGGKSGLFLGRPLFLWISRLVASAVSPAHAEPALRWFWAAISATAAPLLTLLAARLGLSSASAFMAGIALALSPTFAHTSHQVLTDGPALALSIAALTCAASARPIAAGVMIAAAIGMRETAAIHLVAMALLLGRREAAKCIATVAAILAAIVVIDRPPGIGEWFGAMTRSASTHQWSPRDLMSSLLWVLACGPLFVVAGLWTLIRKRHDVGSRLGVVSWPALAATIALMFYPDGSFSPRYVLAAAPIAFFPAAGIWMEARPLLAAIGLIVPLSVGALAADRANTVAKYGARWTHRIQQVPARAVVVPGHFCPQARLAAAIAQRDDLTFVCPGWSWPADLNDELDRALKDGRPVAVDQSNDAWIGPREVQPRAVVQGWIDAHPEAKSISELSVVVR